MASEGPRRGADWAVSRTADVDSAADLELVRRARAGDQPAFCELIERHRRSVYRAAFAALGSADEADDVAQEAFVAAYRHLRAFRGQSSFKTWLLAITWRKAVSRRRSLRRWLQMAVARDAHGREGGFPIDQVPCPERNQEGRLADRELQQIMRRLIGALPRRLRDPLLLIATGEYKYEQVSEMLGAPVGTLKWRVSEARRLLRSKLAALGYYDA
jgi:RNA polymerase sigma-70 factor (ECF subfamily)